jgi:ornithine decarboxylase
LIRADALEDLARRHGTPLIVVDHAEIRRRYQEFRRLLPRVQVYYSVKANSDPAILRTLYQIGASFDVASMTEFLLVYQNIKDLPEAQRQQFIWDKVIYANPVKAVPTLRELNAYKPLVTYDNHEEVRKIRSFAPDSGLLLRVRVPNTGAVVVLANKFGCSPGEALGLLEAAREAGLTVEGLSFHVGSQNTRGANYVAALQMIEGVLREARLHRHDSLKIVDIGGGFPAPYNDSVRPFSELAETLAQEIERLFPPPLEIIAEPGRFLVATAATCVASVIGKAQRNGRRSYYLDDGVYQTFSGIVFDRCQYRVKAFRQGPAHLAAVYGPTCDGMDTISLGELLPDLQLGDLVYSENIGAYSSATATSFNGFAPARVVHVDSEKEGSSVA